MSRSQVPSAARAARAVTDLVGDACVVLCPGTGGRLEVHALGHRDPERRAVLGEYFARSQHSESDQWLGHVLEKAVSFKLRHEAAAAVVGAEGAGLGISAAALAPLRVGGSVRGVVVALRDSCDFPYSDDEQRRVERLAAGLGLGDGAGHVRLAEREPSRVLEEMQTAVVTTDRRGETTYANHAACELVGAPAGHLVGQPIQMFLPDAAPRDSDGPRATQRDELLRRADGTEMWVLVSCSRLTDSAGRAAGAVYTLVDVGVRKGAELAARMRAGAFEAASDFAVVAMAGERFDVLAEEAVAIVAEQLGAELAALSSVAPGAERRTVVAVRGWPRDYLGLTALLPEHSPGRLCLDEPHPVVVRDFDAIECLDCGELAHELAPRSAMCASVGDGVGILSAHSPRPGAFSGQDLSWLDLITGALALRWEAARPARMPQPVRTRIRVS